MRKKRRRRTFGKIFFMIVLVLLNQQQKSNATRFREIVSKATAADNLLTIKAGINDQLKKVLEKLKETLVLLDPVSIGPLPKLFPIDWEDLKGTFNVKKIDLSGISNYKVNDVKFTIKGLQLYAFLEWPLLLGTLTNYTINSRLMNFINVIGEGNGRFSLRNLNFAVNTSLATNTTTKKLYIKMLDTEFSLDNFQIDLHGLYDDNDVSEVMSAVINNIFDEAFNIYYDGMKKGMDEIILNVANPIISKFTLQDLIALLNNYKK